MKVNLQIDVRECSYWDYETHTCTHTCGGCEDLASEGNNIENIKCGVLIGEDRYCTLDVDIYAELLKVIDEKTPTPDHPIPIDTQMYIKELESRVNNNGWVPCSEYVPEDGDLVLCYGKNREGRIKYEVSTYAHEIQCWMCSRIAEVIAWQPLPEQYKGE